MESVKKEVARDKFIIVRYTEAEKQAIDALASELGMSTSVYVRICVADAMRRGVKLPKGGVAQ